MTIKVPEEQTPEITFPVWLIGLPLPPNSTTSDLVEGLSLLATSSGDKALPIFLDETAASEFIVTSGGENCKNCVPRIVRQPVDLHLLLGFLAEKQGVNHVLIGKPNKTFGMSKVVKVRFNIAMQLE